MRPTYGSYAALAAVDAALAVRGSSSARRLTKPLLVPQLLPGANSRSRRALALGWAGDVALLGRGDAAFRVGLTAFLAGHLAWVDALRRRDGGGLLRRRPVLAAPVVLAWAGLTAYLWPRTGRDRVPVLAYATALAATALAALDTGRPVTATGGALFLISDALLALERFADLHLPGHEGLVMASYAAAQAALAYDGREP